jgi:hypothetical protein
MQIENSDGLESFRIFDSAIQPISESTPNPCAERNGNCSHFCLLIPGMPHRS